MKKRSLPKGERTKPILRTPLDAIWKFGLVNVTCR